MNVLKAMYFSFHERLPKAARDRLLSYWINSRFRRMVRRRRAARNRAIKAKVIAEHGRVGHAELGGVLRNSGIDEGDVLFVQCSFNDLHTFEGSAANLVGMLDGLIGPGGTLFMPSYTDVQFTPLKPFRPVHDPTYTGIVSEIFRRSSGVVRSMHPRHSICGRGPLAREVLADHELCTRADGPSSPFDKMRYLPNAKVLTLGLPRGHISFLHWIEDFEPEKLPFPVHRASPVISATEMPDGSVVSVRDWQVRSDIAARLSLDRLFGRLSSDSSKFFTYKGIAIGIYPLAPLARELLVLRDNGVIHYH